jgi:hypothetical protein
VRVWDSGTGKPVKLLAGYQTRWTSGALTHAGDKLACFDSRGALHVVDLPAGQPQPLAGIPTDLSFRLALSPNGRSLAVGYLETWARLLDLGNGKPPMKVAVAVHDMSFAWDSEMLATAAGELRLWDARTGKELATMRAPASEWLGKDGPTAFAVVTFSRDGRWLATSDNYVNRGTLRLWEVATGQLVLTINDLANPVRALAFAPDSSVLVVCSAYQPELERPATFWDLATGQCVGEVRGHVGGVSAIAFAPDGRTFLTGGTDGNILLWDTQALPRAKPPVARPLSAAELTALWQDLAGDARKTYQAIVTLSAGGKDSVAFFQQHLTPEQLLPAAELDRVIADLNDERYAVRAKAMALLETQSAAAVKALRQVLDKKVSLELRRRVELLLGKLEQFTPPPLELRKLRALAVLERMGDVPARQLIEALAKGSPEARLTQQARAALLRLGKQQG